MKINNVTLIIVFVALIAATFLPQWITATNRDITEIQDTGASAMLIAAILGITKWLTGHKKDE